MFIEKGHFGDVSLDGLKIAYVFQWPGAVHEGQGQCLPIVDEKADEALTTLMSGAESDPFATMSTSTSRAGEAAPGFAPVSLFAAGYLAAWLGFSVVATVLQHALERVGLMSGMMMWSQTPWLSAAVLATAGAFLAGRWRPGRRGAFVMGCGHGVFCIACCWALMALLFVGGIMNLLWIAGLAVFVLIEKVVPRGELFARLAGLACLLAAARIAASAAS